MSLVLSTKQFQVRITGLIIKEDDNVGHKLREWRLRFFLPQNKMGQNRNVSNFELGRWGDFRLETLISYVKALGMNKLIVVFKKGKKDFHCSHENIGRLLKMERLHQGVTGYQFELTTQTVYNIEKDTISCMFAHYLAYARKLEIKKLVINLN